MAIRNENYGGTDWVDQDLLLAVDINDTFDIIKTVVDLGN